MSTVVAAGPWGWAYGWAEPMGGGGRPTGMPTSRTHTLLPGIVLAVCAAALSAACSPDANPGGPDRTAATGSPARAEPTASGRPTGPPGTETVASRVAYFSTTARITTGTHQVLHDQAELTRFAQEAAAQDQQAAHDIVAGGGATDFTRGVLVAWTVTTGCSQATSAALGVAGDRLELRVSQPKPPPECFAADRLAVVFVVPKDRMPARPVFG